MASIAASLTALVIITSSVVNAAQITFDCNAIPETCNNMCFGANNGGYFEQHYDSNTANRPGRRTAAGCAPHPNRCNSNPPTTDRTTCDEYPFASSHGTGNGGWFDTTGASTRCVSTTECSSQGGSLSAFYQSFGQVDQTPVDVFVSNFDNGVSPFCENAQMANDGQMQFGGQPPNKRDGGFRFGAKPPNKRGDTGQTYLYRTAGNRTIRALSGPAEIGSEVFIPNLEWQNNAKVASILRKRQGDAPNDDCAGTGDQAQAASLLSTDELGSFDKIVQKL